MLAGWISIKLLALLLTYRRDSFGGVGLVGGMKKIFLLLLGSSALLFSQGARPADLTASPQAVGEPGIAWYTTWDTALAEAKRSQRPIFFMAAAATCNGVPGVF